MSAIDSLIENVSKQTLIDFSRTKSGNFKPSQRAQFTKETPSLLPVLFQQIFSSLDIVGYFSDIKLMVFAIRLQSHLSLSERSSRRMQYDYAKFLLNKASDSIHSEKFTRWLGDNDDPDDIDKALFVFYDDQKHFRFSLVEGLNPKSEAPKRYRRYTFFVDPTQSNRTFKERMAKPWTSFQDIKDAFSVERLSQEFFDKYKEIYQNFVTAAIEESATRTQFEQKFPGVWDKAIRDYVKKMMGRLVFLQFLQKKGWLGVKEGEQWGTGDKQYLLHLFQSKPENDRGNFLEDVLEKLFFHTLNVDRTANGDLANEVLATDHPIRIPYLNGGLFDMDEADKLTAKFANASRLFHDLFDNFERFNFTVDENAADDAEIGVDPEMLGHIFENLLEDNKDKGAFYTPKEIVQYMCQKSLAAYLGDTPAMHQLVLETDASAISESDKPALLEKLRAVKICDPAIGSGAFPMGLLNLLLNVRSVLGDIEDTAAARVQIKQDIILNNIYGVDIEAGAIDIARLRFWLSIVVDAQEPIPLPYFDYKFMQGNSLLESFMGVDLSGIYSGSKPYKPKDSAPNRSPKIPQAVDEKQQILDLYEGGGTVYDISSDIKKYYSEAQPENREVLRANIHQHVILFINKSVSNDVDIAVKLQDEIRTKAAVITLGIAPFTLWHLYFSEVFDKGGFDIVIGNPPYVSTKGRDLDNNANLESAYGFADDLYSHFVFLGYNLLKENGIQTMITPDTYFTTLTKKRLRDKILNNTLLELVHWGHDIFDSAMVSTATFISQKKPPQKTDCLTIRDVKGKKTVSEASVFTVKQDIFASSINGAFFVPHKLNCTINDRFAKRHAALLAAWWDKISDSKKTNKNENILDSYRQQLRPGDMTLIGLVADGGQGLATGDNGRYVGVLATSKIADRIRISRMKKLQELNQKHHANYTMPESEENIWRLFDDIKNKYGRRAFGKGFIYRIVPDHLIADVHSLTEKEKENGITSERSFVPYDKGDKDGNRWYLETPYVIDWGKDSLSALKNDPSARFQNTKFFFKEGFCWNNNLNENYCNIKCRLKLAGIHDVASMSMFELTERIPTYYIMTIINSFLCGHIYRNFLNATVNVQLNDLRALPIVVPSAEQLVECKKLYDSAIAIQKAYFAKLIDLQKRNVELQTIQDKVDAFVYALYGIETTEYLNHSNSVYTLNSDAPSDKSDFDTGSDDENDADDSRD